MLFEVETCPRCGAVSEGRAPGDPATGGERVSSVRRDEDEELQGVALRDAQSLLAARQRAEADLVQARQALEAKAEQLARLVSTLRATLEASTDGILVTDEDGTILDFNAAYVTLWGLPEEVMAAGEFRGVLEHSARRLESPERFLERMATIRASSAPESFDVWMLENGRIFEQRSRMQFVEGRRAGRVWSVRDVTEREIADKEHAYLAEIIASSTDAIVSKSLEGIVTSWNSGAERIFGYSAEEMIGQPITTIIPEDRRDEETLILDRLRRGERIEHFETLRRHRDGHLVHVSLTVSPVRNRAGQMVGASKIARDISEREELLERERAARARAEEASRLKDEFLATVSHELRTPLNAILGWAHILRSVKLDEAKARHAAEVVERNARGQAQVIDDLLDVSRIITGKLRLDISPIMPDQAIESALDSVRPMAEAKGVRLDTMLDPHAGPVSADSGRLQQVVWNLLTNAIKFTPRDGRVEVRLERINSHLEIVVSDSGEGISPEFLPFVFDRFRQADASSTRLISGLGLGLTIVNHLVELHGGSVQADSPGKGRGATFTVRLPLRPIRARKDDGDRVHPRPQVTDEYLPFSAAPRLDGVRVLVVDDEADTRELLRELLAQCGAEVREAGTAQEALDMVKEWRPGVLVSDIGMPGEDGYTLIRKLRRWEQEVGTWIPAVALTAYARSEDRMRALSAGYQVHVSKPVEPMEFAFVVAGIVHRPNPPAA